MVKIMKTTCQNGRVSKSKNKKTYEQKYRPAWETDPVFKGWLRPSPTGLETQAYCVLCKKQMRAHKKDLVDHVKSLAHTNNAKIDGLPIPKITKFIIQSVEDERKNAELRVAVFVASHCSFNASTALARMIRTLDNKSDILMGFKLGRTKCTGLISNVLAPCLMKELVADVGDAHYSLIIDETTSIDIKKLLCIMIRYFSASKGKIITTLYRLVDIQSGNAETVTNTVMQLLKEDSLNLLQLVGIGVDGANVMVGKNNSLSSRLTEKIPHLVTVKCVCHSLNHVCENAAALLPGHLDSLVKRTHKYFSNSSNRINQYKELFATMNEGKPRKIPKLATTRWLTRENATKVILDQWDALKLFFQLAKEEKNNELAVELHGWYSSESNKLFLIFLRDSLKDVVNLNKLFQSESVNALKLFEDLSDLFYSILQKIVVPAQLGKTNRRNSETFDFRNYLMPSECINFGYEFVLASRNFTPEKIKGIRSICKSVLVELCVQLQQRMPHNIQILEQISVFTPQERYKENRDVTNILVRFKNIVGDIDAALNEWECLHVKVHPTEGQSAEEYWSMVCKIKTAGGDRRYGHISKLVLAMLALPISNATVERAFSLVNVIKDKLRNSMAVKSCEAVLRIRYDIKEAGDFESTEEMRKQFNSEKIYASQFDDKVLDIF